MDSCSDGYSSLHFARRVVLHDPRRYEQAFSNLKRCEGKSSAEVESEIAMVIAIASFLDRAVDRLSLEKQKACLERLQPGNWISGKK